MWNNKYLLVFLGIFVWIFSWGCTISFYFKAKRDDHYEAFLDYVLCNAAMEEDCVNKDPAPVWLSYVHIINMSNVGTYCFLLFGCQTKVRRHWKKVVRLIAMGEFKSAVNLSIEAQDKTLTRSGSKITGVTLDQSLTRTIDR